MKNYHLILLSDNENSQFQAETGYFNKAFIPIHQKPLLDWMVETYAQNQYLDQIIVIGPRELEKLACLRLIDKRIEPDLDLFTSLQHHLSFLQSKPEQEKGCLISSNDLLFINPEIISDTITRIGRHESGNDALFFIVNQPDFQKLDVHSRGNYFPIQSQYYKMALIYYVKNYHLFDQLIKNRLPLMNMLLNPPDFFHKLDSLHKSITDLEKMIEQEYGLKIKLLTSPYPQIAFPIENSSHIAMAEKKIPHSWLKHYKRAMLVYNPQSQIGMHQSPFLSRILGIKSRKYEVYADKLQYISKIVQYLNQYGIYPRLVSTQKPGHAIEIARNAVQKGYDLIIAVGGDGTINEIVNGIAGSDIQLGIIPLGTANILSLQLKIPIEIQAACQVIVQGNWIQIDLGQVNQRYFTCMAGVGFDASVVKKADKGLKKNFGALAYLLVAVSSYLSYPFRKIYIRIDDQPVLRKGYFVLIGNSQFYAGEMTITHKAKMSDGYLDICIFKQKHIFSLIAYLWGILNKKIEDIENVEYFQCKKITIMKGKKHAIQVDGDYMGDSPAEIRIHERALKVII